MPTDIALKCKMLLSLGIKYELMSIYQPFLIKLDFMEQMEKCNTMTEYNCPCGSSSNQELNIMAHFKNKHHEASKAYINIKNGIFPFGDID